MTTDAELLAEVREVAAEQRRLDARRIAVASELVARSLPSMGSEGMARRAGYARPALMLAALWKITAGEAQRLCEVGTATRAGRALDGSELPARYPVVTASIAAGALALDSAAVIVHELEAASLRCSAEARQHAEAALVDHAPGLTVAELHILARRVRDRLDEDGPEPRDELRRAKRALRMFPTRTGMLRLEWELTPEAGGLVKAGIDAIVGEQLRQERDDALLSDRTLEQRRSDAAEQIFRHAATCSRAAGDLPAITMVVRMTLDSLVNGLGVAGVDGVDETISAATARRLAADAELIPIVLGGAGEVLDVGRARRLFSRAQKLAAIERDGGCAFAGCTSPPSFAEGHHLRWWSRGGTTDLDNCVMLCAFHHHRIHDDGWRIELREQVPYFIPPPWIDPARTPRRGGRVRWDGAA